MTDLNKMPPTTNNQRVLTTHLPNKLVGYVLLLIISNIYLMLIQQPISYWVDYGEAFSDFAWEQQLLAVHPLLFVGVAIIYMVAVSFALLKLPGRLALIVWMMVCFIHIQSFASGLSGAFRKLSNLEGAPTYTLEFLILILLFCVQGWILARFVTASKDLDTTDEEDVVPQTKFSLSSPVTISIIVWGVCLNVLLLFSMYIPKIGWHPIKVANAPPPRAYGEIAYDTHRGVAVLFGGWPLVSDDQYIYFNDTWEWDGATWVQRFPDVSPTGREKFAMAYDEKREVVVLFGGAVDDNVLGDTWEWDGDTWVQKYPISNPPARCCYAMTYDEKRQQIIVYGGYGGGTQFFTDAWTWDGEKWSEIISDSLEKPVLSGDRLVYHQALDEIIAFPYTGITWQWKNASWLNLELDITPPSRQYEGMVYDPTGQQIIMFGGAKDSFIYSDTWRFDGQTWDELDFLVSPSGRRNHIMFYDQVRGRIIIFGGYDGESYQNDMWELVLTPDD